MNEMREVYLYLCLGCQCVVAAPETLDPARHVFCRVCREYHEWAPIRVERGTGRAFAGQPHADRDLVLRLPMPRT